MNLAAAINGNVTCCGDQEIVAAGGSWRDWSWIGGVSSAILEIVDGRGACALVARNRPQHIAAFASGILGRHTTSMIYSAQSPDGIARDIERLKPPVVLADPEDWCDETLAAARRSGSAAVAIRDAKRATDCVKVLHPAAIASGGEGTQPDTAFELLSSGTTGPPKRVALSWRVLESAVADAQGAYSGTGNTTAPQIMTHPLGNVASIGYVAPPLVYNQRLVLLEKFAPLQWAAAVKQYQPIRGSVPPAGIRMLLDAGVAREDLGSLKLIAVGGGRLDPELHRQFEAHYGIPILTAFGATEFGGVIANWTPELYREWGSKKRGSAGRASANVQLRAVDPDTFETLPPSTTGLLEALVPRVSDQWIRTNDLVMIDDDGFLFHRGRADFAINRGGFKIVPDVVNAAVNSHPLVADAATVAIADERLGEVPCTAVELKAGQHIEAESLKSWLKPKLLAYEIPVAIKIVARLPRNPSMKISLPEVKALFDEDTR